MDHRYNNNGPVRDRSRGSRERDPIAGGMESNYGRLNALEQGDGGTYGGRGGGMGRGRSPITPQMQRRRRSRSPPAGVGSGMGGNIDRYVPGGSPRPRRSRSPPPGRGGPGRYDGPAPYGQHNRQNHNIGNNIDRYIPSGMMGVGMMPGLAGMPNQLLQDPHKLDYAVTYTYFSEWYYQENGKARERETIPKDEVQAAFDRYKEELNGRLAKQFVAQHKNDEWFKERYLPGEKEITKTKVVAFRREQWKKWRILLETGAFDEVDRETKIVGTNVRDGMDSGDVVEEINRGCDDGGLRPVLLIKTISPTVSRKQLEELATSNLTNFHFVSLSDPNPLKKFHRIGFILLHNQDPDDPMSEPSVVDESTVDLLNGKSIHDETHGDFTCHVGIHNGPTNPKARKLLNEYMSMPANLRKEADFIERCALKLEAELRSDDEPSMEEYEGWEAIKEKVEIWGRGERDLREISQEEGEEGAESEVELKILKKKIDIGVEYLRRAFNFCMYCVSSSDSIHELTRKCPGGHIRRPTPSPDYSADTRTINWTKNWQDKLELFVNPPLNPEADDYDFRLRKVGGKPIPEFVHDELQKFMKQEDEGKYRCRVDTCHKLFKGEEFWKKHLDKKHSEFLESLRLEGLLVNAYVTDPTRVYPPKIEQNAQGNFVASNGGRGSQSYGGGGGGSNTPNGSGGPPPMFTGGAQGFMPFNTGFLPNSNTMLPGLPMTNVGPIRRHDNRNSLPRGNSNHSLNGGNNRNSNNRYNSPSSQQPYIRQDRAEREKERERRDREMKEAQARRTAGGVLPPIGGPGGVGGVPPITGSGAAALGAMLGITAGGLPLPVIGGGMQPDGELAVVGRAMKSYKDLDASGGGAPGKGDELDY